jgi:hypothetical protein
MIWHPRIRWIHIKSILVGFLAMVLSLIALWVILGVIVRTSKRDIPIGPVYLLIPILTFPAGCYWSLRRSSRAKVPAKPPSNVTIIVKSTALGITAMIGSVIAYLIGFWLSTRRDGIALVSFDVVSIIHRPVLVGVFLVGFGLEYRIVSRRRSTFTGGVAH